MAQDRKKILLVGGGSGGHIVPVFELYKKLKERKDLSILLIGGGGEIESYFYNDIPEYKRIYSGKMHRVLTWKNILEALKLCLGICQSVFIIAKFKPQLIFSKGGFVSLPIVFWSKVFNIPLLVHESDIAIGMTNSYAAKKALKVFVGYPQEFYSDKLKSKLCYSGQLINPKLDKKEMYDFSFNNDQKTILFLGGSQGSHRINRVVFGCVERLSNYNIIHQTGIDDYHEAEELSKRFQFYKPYIFLKSDNKKDMLKSALSSSDIVVTRAGATSIAEVVAFNKPLIVVPYKHASLNHQVKNAEWLMQNKAAIMIQDDELNGERLNSALEKVLNNNWERDQLIKNAVKIVKVNGIDIVAEEIIKLLDIK